MGKVINIYNWVHEVVKSADEYGHAIAVADVICEQGKYYLERVALLHDIVEDGYATIEELKEMWKLSDGECAILDTITRRKDEKYFDYIKRVKQNPAATIIKLADLTHNIQRCANDLDNRWGLLRRYAKAYGMLKGEWTEQ